MRSLLLLSSLLGSALSAAIPLPLPAKTTTKAASASETPFNNPSLHSELVDTVGYSEIAYCMFGGDLHTGALTDACPISVCTNSQGSKKVLDVFNSDVSAYVVQDDTNRELVVTFKGTTTIEEWLIDFDAISVAYTPYTVSQKINTQSFSCPGCKVHQGFYASTQVFMNDVFPVVRDLVSAHPNYRLKVTGHSLGAALAVLAANEFRMVGLDVSLITYAGPKFGNDKLSQWLDTFWNTDSTTTQLQQGGLTSFSANSFIRVVRSDDVVPMVPLIGMGYSHSGCELRADANGNVWIRGKWQAARERQDIKNLEKQVMNELIGQHFSVLAPIEGVVTTHMTYFADLMTCEPLFDSIFNH